MFSVFRKIIIGLISLITASAILAPVVFAGGSFSIQPRELKVLPGDFFTFSISVDTGDAEIAGAGAKIIYDPGQINIIKIDTGSIFSDYPSPVFDNQTGKMDISGISSSPDQLFKGAGLFATIQAQAKNSGVSKITLEFVPGDTTDSNLVITAPPWDILSAVNNLTVTIVSPSPPAAKSSITPPQNPLIFVFAGIGLVVILLIIFIFIKSRHPRIPSDPPIRSMVV
jgi:hypothetical protein